MKHTFEDGKYTVVLNETTGELYALRYGEAWRDLSGDKLICAMLAEIDELKKTAVTKPKMKKIGVVIWLDKEERRFAVETSEDHSSLEDFLWFKDYLRKHHPFVQDYVFEIPETLY